MKSRVVIEQVPKVAFAPIHDGKWEFTPFLSCLKAVCSFLGCPLPYHYLMGASGAAFRMVWHAKRWEGGNVDLVFMAEDPFEPFFRGLRAAGVKGTLVLNRAAWGPQSERGGRRAEYVKDYLSDDETDFRKRIVESIAQGVPVIALGVVGPPEACIITGYDDSGDTLIGWSMFQEHFDPVHDLSPGAADGMNPPSGIEENGYFRRNEWFHRTDGILIVELESSAEPDTIYAESLRWIAQIIRSTCAHEFRTGLAAYEGYIEKLKDDNEFTGRSEQELVLRKMVHYDAMTMIAERSNGGLYLRDISSSGRFASVRTELERAADNCRAAASEMEAWWKIVGQIWNDEPAQVRATADPATRKAFAAHIEAARLRDQETAELISVACEKAGL